MSFLLGRPIFRCSVSLGEGNIYIYIYSNRWAGFVQLDYSRASTTRRDTRGRTFSGTAETATYQGIVGCTPGNVPLWEIPI